MVAARSVRIGVGLAPVRGPTLALLPNGDASSASTPPTLGSGVVISGGHFTCTAAGQIVTWSGVLTIGHRYYVTLQYNASSANGLRVNGSTVNGANVKDIESVTADSTTRSLTIYAFIADSTDLSIEANGATFTGWIDNVVASELSIPSPLTNSDFYELAATAGPTLGTGATQPPGSVTWAGGGTMLATWTGVLTVGQQYSIAVAYSCSSGSKLRISNSATDGTNVVDIQTLTIDGSPHTLTFATFTASSADLVLGADTANFIGTLTNVTATLIPSGGTTHPTTGALTGPGSTIAGTAAYNAVHPTSGVLTGPGSTIAGTAHIAVHGTTGALTGPGSTIAGSAARTAVHTTTGVLTGQGSAIAGVAVYNAKHTTSGALTGPGSVVVGAAARTRAHATTGVLTGPGSTIGGTAVYNAKHTTSGTLAGPGSTVAGTAARFRAFATSGVLIGLGSTIVGAALRGTISTTHATSGALVGQPSIILGTAGRMRQHATSGVLIGPSATVFGHANRSRDHDTSGVLLGVTGVVFGRAFNGTPQLHDIPVDSDNLTDEPASPSANLGTITEPSGQIVNHPPYPPA